jgi:hypothetical protein
MGDCQWCLASHLACKLGLVSSRPTRSAPLPIRFYAAVGQHTHAVIAQLITAGVLAPSLTAVSAYVSWRLAANPLPCDRRRGQMLITSMVFTYFERYLPPPPWKLVGVEVSVEADRFDLIYANDVGEIWIDELKAQRCRPGQLDPDSSDQLARYIRAGELTYGLLFQGARLVVLGPPAHGYWVSAGATTANPLPPMGLRQENLLCLNLMDLVSESDEVGARSRSIA